MVKEVEPYTKDHSFVEKFGEILLMQEPYLMDANAGCIPLAVLVMIGMIPGVLFLKNADIAFLKSFFGVVIILIGLEMLLREFWTKKEVKQSKVILSICKLY